MIIVAIENCVRVAKEGDRAFNGFDEVVEEGLSDFFCFASACRMPELCTSTSDTFSSTEDISWIAKGVYVVKRRGSPCER